MKTHNHECCGKLPPAHLVPQVPLVLHDAYRRKPLHELRVSHALPRHLTPDDPARLRFPIRMQARPYGATITGAPTTAGCSRRSPPQRRSPRLVGRGKATGSAGRLNSMVLARRTTLISCQVVYVDCLSTKGEVCPHLELQPIWLFAQKAM